MSKICLSITALMMILTGSSMAQEPFVLKNKGDEVHGELKRFTVPENRHNPNTRDIELVYLHLKTQNPNPKPPIVYLAGGPGVSGVNTIRYALQDMVLPLLEDRDVIALDQRGTGRSNGLPTCNLDKGLPLDQAADRDAYEARARETASACAQFWREQGVDLEAYTTEENADDVDALRQNLGVEKIALWGGSYGSHLALSVLRRHEAHIDRVLVNGVEGPDHTLKLPSDTQALLEHLDKKAAQLGVMKGRSFLETVETVITRLKKQPQTAFYKDDKGMDVKVVISAFDIQLLTAKNLRGPDEMKRLPAGFLRMVNGEFDFLAKTVAQLRNPRVLRAMPVLTDAASGASAHRLAKIKDQRDRTLLGDASNMCLHAAIEGLGLPGLGDPFRSPIQSSVPVLLVSGSLDGRTPPANAEEVLKGLPNGAHILVEGAGHSGDIFTRGNTLQYVMDFLHGKKVASAVVAFGQKRTGMKMDARELKAYEGAYAMPDGDAIIKVGEGVLAVHYRDRDLELRPKTRAQFFNDDPKIRITFLFEGDKVTGFKTRLGQETVIAEKRL